MIVSWCDVTNILRSIFTGLCCNGADMCLFMTDEIDDTDDNGDTDA